jgi:hypothetical protein
MSFQLAPFRGQQSQKLKNLKTSSTTELIDDHQTLSVAFLGSLLSKLLILIWLAPIRGL